MGSSCLSEPIVQRKKVHQIIFIKSLGRTQEGGWYIHKISKVKDRTITIKERVTNLTGNGYDMNVLKYLSFPAYEHQKPEIELFIIFLLSCLLKDSLSLLLTLALTLGGSFRN